MEAVVDGVRPSVGLKMTMMRRKANGNDNITDSDCREGIRLSQNLTLGKGKPFGWLASSESPRWKLKNGTNSVSDREKRRGDHDGGGPMVGDSPTTAQSGAVLGIGNSENGGGKS